MAMVETFIYTQVYYLQLQRMVMLLLDYTLMTNVGILCLQILQQKNKLPKVQLEVGNLEGVKQMKLDKITKHEQCSVGVLELQKGPHTGELVCIDTNCTHTSKHIKWVSAYERAVIEDLNRKE